LFSIVATGGGARPRSQNLYKSGAIAVFRNGGALVSEFKIRRG